jgi:cysteine desulfurase/selenocysteine lyase
LEKLSTLNLREEFPILGRKIHGKPLVYFDSAATSQKPKAVIDSITDFYSNTNANVHRGAYLLSQEATTQYEGVRKKVCKFLGTSKEKEIIFTSGTTGAINLVASTLGEESVNEGDTIVVTRMEHHSNFVPWQSLAKRKKANFKIVELRTDGTLDLDSLSLALSGRPKILAITMMSNVLGTLNPIREIASLAKEQGAVVLVDAAQAVAHTPVKIADLGPVDFVAFSAHKLYGPTGVGILWGKEKILNEMKPYQFGGDMILHVKDQDTEFNQLPWKFEAGTPNLHWIGSNLKDSNKFWLTNLKLVNIFMKSFLR